MADKPLNSRLHAIFHQVSRLVMALVVLACSALLAGSRTPTELELVLAAGELNILSRNGSTTYYEGKSGLAGFEYTLGKAFADRLGVKLVINEEEKLADILNKVNDPQYNFGASALTITAERSEQVMFSEPYMDVSQQVLYRRGESRPKTPVDLIGKKILVIANSSHAEHLRSLKKRFPTLSWEEAEEVEMIDLVAMIDNGTIDHTIVDSNAFTVSRNLFPKAQVAFDIAGSQKLAWAFQKQKDMSLYKAAQEFILESKENGKIQEFTDQYYSLADDMNKGGALVFAHRIESRLPKWQEILKENAEEFDLDWQLIAAISYQESHWNARARSPTGVRGLMMLTLTTAKEMGVTNRLDPEQSIHGGAKYFRKIYDRIPKDILEPDRAWLALAAYNVGYGHLEDARKITQGHGGDPDKWDDVKTHLPKLAKRAYYRKTKHGYARGWEPVSYVQNIRSYYNVLAWHEQMNMRQLAAADKAATDSANYNGGDEQLKTTQTSTMENHTDGQTTSL